MATSPTGLTIDGLPSAGGLSDGDLLEISQSNVSRKLPVSQLKAYANLFVPHQGMMLMGDSIGQKNADTKTSLVQMVCALSNQMWVFRKLFAIPGNTPAQIRDGQLPQVLSSVPLPKTCAVEAGYNPGVSPEDDLVIIEDIYVKLLAKGITPIVVYLHPRVEAPAWEGDIHTKNNGLAKLQSKYGLPIWDLAGIFWAPQGYAFKDPTLTEDGTHITTLGICHAALEILKDPRFTELAPKDGGVQTMYSNTDPRNWMVNGLFMFPGQNGQPAYWEKSTTGDATIETIDAPGGRGKAMKVTSVGGVFGGMKFDAEVNSGGMMEVICTIESEWGALMQTDINAVNTGNTNADALAKEALIPWPDLLRVEFSTGDRVTALGTAYALGRPGSKRLRMRIRAEIPVPVGAGRGVFIFSAFNANSKAGETWATIEELAYRRLW